MRAAGEAAEGGAAASPDPTDAEGSDMVVEEGAAPAPATAAAAAAAAIAASSGSGPLTSQYNLRSSVAKPAT